jgi:tetratricopeptide (TPR) repeat protein
LEIDRSTSSGFHFPKNPAPLTEVPGPSAVLELEDLFCILQAEPLDSVIALELGRRLHGLGRRDEALRVLRGVCKIDNRFETLTALGRLEYEMEMFDESFRHLQQALLIAPENTPEFFDLFKTLGDIFARRSDWDSAEDSYNKAHRLRPDSDVIAVNLGTLQMQKMRWDEALTRFRAALQWNPANDRAWIGLALGHRAKGDWELAWGNLEAALDHNPLNEAGIALALEWGAREGRGFRVLEFLRAFLIRGGWSEKFSLAFARMSRRRGDAGVARLEIERVLVVNPASREACELLEEMR